MKKYVKPELFYERYELSQHIADCAWELKFATKETCIAYSDEKHWGDSETTLFTPSQSCDIDWNLNQVYCYQAGTDGMNVFAS